MKAMFKLQSILGWQQISYITKIRNSLITRDLAEPYRAYTLGCIPLLPAINILIKYPVILIHSFYDMEFTIHILGCKMHFSLYGQCIS